MSELPKGWELIAVQEVAELFRGVTYKKDQVRKEAAPGFLPVLRANNINGSLNLDDLVFVPKQFVSQEQLIRKGDIVFAMSSGSINLVGKSAQVQKDIEGSIGAFCGLLRPCPFVSDSYLAKYFQANSFKRHIKKIAKGTNINNLKREHILLAKIPLPPLNEQKRIVAKIEELFSELDAGVAALKQAREKLKVYRQAVLKAAFEGRLTEAWRKEHADELESADELLAAIRAEREARYQQQLAEWRQQVADWEADGGKASGKKKPKKPRKPKELPPLTAEELADLPDLPEGWAWVTVEHLGAVETGTTPPKRDTSNYGNQFPFYKPSDLEAGYNVRKAAEYLSPLGLNRSRLLPENSILVTCIGSIGKTGICRVRGASNQQINSIIPLNVFDPNFIYFQVISERFQRTIRENASSTTLPILNKAKFSILPMEICSRAEQRQIVQEIESRFSVVEKMEQAIDEGLKKAEALRQSILRRAFEGRLVPQDPNDEPASELLARIRAEREGSNSGNRGRKSRRL